MKKYKFEIQCLIVVDVRADNIKEARDEVIYGLERDEYKFDCSSVVSDGVEMNEFGDELK